MDKLEATLSFGGILTAVKVEHILPYWEGRELKAGEEFLRCGNVSDVVGFVHEGIFRSYSIDKNGDEVTKYFIRPNQFVVDLESYYSSEPSQASIQAVTHSQISMIRKKELNRLSEEIPELFILTKSLTEAHLLNKIKDNDFLNFGTSTEKYIEFVKRYPELALQVPQQYIASYLKITPQSLSRIRKNLHESI